MKSLWARGGAHARLSTLIFHRVLPAPDPLFPDEMHAQRFDALCGWLARWFNVLPLHDALRRLRERSLPARALAITFDDGYADNHDVALPLLQRHGLPATFFITTGFLDGGRMWNDTVIEAIRGCPHDRVALDADDRASPAPLFTPADRRALVDRVLQRLKHLPPPQRDAEVARVAAQCGVRPGERPMMTSQQVRSLHSAGMGIGAHTVSHPILAVLDDAAARAEIVGSRDALQDLLQAPVKLFAYPNGRPAADYDARSVKLVREAGFDAAVSTAWGAASTASDPFQLPRFTPWDSSRWKFGLRLLTNLKRVEQRV